MIYVVVDTNVIISALYTSNSESPTIKIVEAFLRKEITLLYNEEIINEYEEVLRRPKFKFPNLLVENFLVAIKRLGILSDRVDSGEFFYDEDDAVFYEVALSKDNALLVTGNAKHFPKSPIVVTPAELISIIENNIK